MILYFQDLSNPVLCSKLSQFLYKFNLENKNIMKLIVKPSKISGTAAVPGSKSHTIRGVIASILAEGESILHSPLQSADTASALNAAVKLGAKFHTSSDGAWHIQGIGRKIYTCPEIIDLGNSGTSLRLLSAAAGIFDKKITFDGDSSLRTRTMDSLLKALEILGAKTSSCNGKAPLSVQGPIRGGKCTVSGATSQYLSALLFAVPFAAENTIIDLEFLNEQPYVEMTLKWLDFLGIKYKASKDLLHFEIEGNQKFNAFEKVIPADFSTSLFVLGAALQSGMGKGVEIENLDFSDTQGDKEVFRFFEQSGAKISYGKNVHIPAVQNLKGGKFDLNNVPDSLPIFSAVAAGIKGETFQCINVPQARIKETDRIDCMTRELRKMGGIIEELPDGMIVTGTQLHGSNELESYDDHRIGMALAVAALNADSPSIINGIECAAVTYPDFVKQFQKLGADFKVIE